MKTNYSFNLTTKHACLRSFNSFRHVYFGGGRGEDETLAQLCVFFGIVFVVCGTLELYYKAVNITTKI